MAANTKDLTEGSIRRVLLGFAAPLFLSQLFQRVRAEDTAGHLGTLGEIRNRDSVGLPGNGGLHIGLHLIPVVLHAEVRRAVIQRSSLQRFPPVGIRDIAGQTGRLALAGR